MAIAYIIPGACQVKIQPTAGALQELGYTAEGVHVREEVRRVNIPVDTNGGTEGIPGDIQYLGEMHFITMELTKWDSAQVALIDPKLAGGTQGQMGTVGTLMSSVSFRVLLNSAVLPRNYLVCFPLGAYETNRGTKYARQVITWEAYPNASNVIWNVTLT